MLESLILALPSAVLGSILAYLAAQIIMPYNIELPSDIYAVIFALVVNFVAGLYPAWKASRMDPVEAIWSG